MAAYRNKNADKISKFVVNIVDATMTMFYIHVLKLCYHCVVAKFTTVLSISVLVLAI